MRSTSVEALVADYAGDCDMSPKRLERAFQAGIAAATSAIEHDATFEESVAEAIIIGWRAMKGRKGRAHMGADDGPGRFRRNRGAPA